MSDKPTDNQITLAAVNAGVQLTPSDIAHIAAQFDGFSVLQSVNVEGVQPTFGLDGEGKCRIERRA